MNVLIASVPHSGTMLISKMFTDLEYSQTSIEPTEQPDKMVLIGHIVNDVDYGFIIDLIKTGIHTIVPIRHPYLVTESWARRGMDISEIKKGYKRLKTLHELGCNFIPIDSKDRDKYFQKTKNNIGIDIKTDWGIVNSEHNTYGLNYKDINPSVEARNLCDEVQDFVDLFYH